MMRHRVVVLAVLSALLASPGAIARGAEVLEPAPIAVPAGRSDADVVRAIKYSLATKEWKVEEEQPGRIVASHSPRTHVARVTVTTAEGQITIRYLDSTNLKFEQDGDKRTIHPAYNGWVQALRDHMEQNVAQGVAEGTAMPTVTAGGKQGNPPPAEKFSNFGRFEMVEATLDPRYAGQQANDDALGNIRHNLNLKLGPVLEQWNAKAAPNARVLRIEPVVDHIRFVGTGARIFAGAMAGRSSVIVKVRYVDVATGNAVAHPEFYLVAGRSGLSISRADYAMLEDIGAIVADYTQANYAEAVGGGEITPADFKREVPKAKPAPKKKR